MTQVVGWEVLGAVPPLALAPQRLVLHHAVQIVAAVGRSLVPPRPDDGHTSLEWVAGAFVSLVVVAGGVEDSRFALSGRTRDEAFAWVVKVAQRLGVATGQLTLDAPYTIPAHSVGAGTPFPAVTRQVAELASWFADGNALVRAAAGTARGGPEPSSPQPTSQPPATARPRRPRRARSSRARSKCSATSTRDGRERESTAAKSELREDVGVVRLEPVAEAGP